MRDIEIMLGPQFLDVTVADGNPKVEPEGLPDYFGRELVTAGGNGQNAPTLLRITLIPQPSCDQASQLDNCKSNSSFFGISLQQPESSGSLVIHDWCL
jgi:hypothetical protein